VAVVVRRAGIGVESGALVRTAEPAGSWGVESEILAVAMSQENVELVRGMYEAFHRGDFDTALASFDPAVEVDASVRVDEGVGHGRDAVATVVGRWVGAWDDWREDIEEMRDLGRHVLVVSTQRGRAKGSGIEVETRYSVLYEVRGGTITRMVLHTGPAEALKAAGLRE
jgi:ketosteroid isomerase-like protein